MRIQTTPAAPPEPPLRGVIEEFGRILEVLRAQLHDSVEDAGRECVALGTAFDAIDEANGRIAAEARASQLSPMLEQSQLAGAALDRAVSALQYQDRLSQRLGHVCAGLDRLQCMLRDGEGRSASQWLELLREVEATQEREHARLAAVDVEPRGSVELF